MSHFIETTMEINGAEDQPVTVYYIHCPFVAGSRDGHRGPKIEPDEEEHIEIDWIEDSFGSSVEPTSRQEEVLLRECAEDYDGRREYCD